MIEAYYWWWPMMAEVTNQASGWDPKDVGTMVGSILIALLGGGYLGKKITESKVTLANNPLQVSLQEQFVRREEFAEFKGEMKADVREMRGLFDKAITLIAERDERLTETINDVASGAYEGRRRLHDKVNNHEGRLARVEVNNDVSKAVGKLGSAVMTLAKSGGKTPE